MKRILGSIIIVAFFPSVLKAEGQEGLAFILDLLYFFVVMIGWILITSLGTRIIKAIKKSVQKRTIAITWLITGLISLTFWSLTKFDPFPYEGPFDSFFNSYPARQKDESEGKVVYNFEDSTVYVWNNGVKEKLRSLTDNEIETKEIDWELTRNELNKSKQPPTIKMQTPAR